MRGCLFRGCLFRAALVSVLFGRSAALGCSLRLACVRSRPACVPWTLAPWNAFTRPWRCGALEGEHAKNSFMRGARRRAARRPRTARGRGGEASVEPSENGASMSAASLCFCKVCTGLVLVRGDRGPSLRRLQLRIDGVLGLFRCGAIGAAPAALCSQSHYSTTLSRSRRIRCAAVA